MDIYLCGLDTLVGLLDVPALNFPAVSMATLPPALLPFGQVSPQLTVTHRHSHAHTHTHTYTLTCTHTHTHADTHTHSLTHIYSHTLTHAHSTLT